MADPMDEAKREAEAGVADDRFSELVGALGGKAAARRCSAPPWRRTA